MIINKKEAKKAKKAKCKSKFKKITSTKNTFLSNIAVFIGIFIAVFAGCFSTSDDSKKIQKKPSVYSTDSHKPTLYKANKPNEIKKPNANESKPNESKIVPYDSNRLDFFSISRQSLPSAKMKKQYSAMELNLLENDVFVERMQAFDTTILKAKPDFKYTKPSLWKRLFKKRA